MLAETGLFAASAVMMGWFGKLSLAAHLIALEEITALFFMVHLGLARNAATVLIGQAKGTGDAAALRAVAHTAVILSLSFAGATMMVYFVFASRWWGCS